MENKNYAERYRRQLILPEFGVAAQQQLAASKVLVVGAGGLGCPALQYMAGAGVGLLTVIDDDQVALHNLHRQPLFKTEDVGKNKAWCAAGFLSSLNPDIRIRPVTERLNEKNCIDLFEQHDLIIDGSDNFATRYMVNDACVITGKPFVYGAVSQFEGQVAIFNSGNSSTGFSANYRDLFPQAPAPGEVMNCAEGGVLGVLPGVIGTMMATEAIKLLTGIGQPLINRLLTVNLLNNQFYEFALQPSAKTRELIPSDRSAFERTRYEYQCGHSISEMSASDFDSRTIDDETIVVDVREPHESPEIDEPGLVRMPMSRLEKNLAGITHKKVIFLCQSGKRSLLAANELAQLRNNSENIFSVSGGVEALLDFRKSITHV